MQTMKHAKKTSSIIAISIMFALTGAINASAAGVQAELRSSVELLPTPGAGESLPTALAGGLGVGAEMWVCDAAQGFAPVVAAETNVPDPILAIGTVGNIRLPISPTTTPATCGQIGYDGHGDVYVLKESSIPR